MSNALKTLVVGSASVVVAGLVISRARRTKMHKSALDSACHLYQAALDLRRQSKESGSKSGLAEACRLFQRAFFQSPTLGLKHDTLSGWCDTLDDLGQYYESENVCQRYGLSQMRQSLREGGNLAG